MNIGGLKMLDMFKKIWAVLIGKEKRQFVLLMFLMLTMALFQAAGVASVLPFISQIGRASCRERV